MADYFAYVAFGRFGVKFDAFEANPACFEGQNAACCEFMFGDFGPVGFIRTCAAGSIELKLSRFRLSCSNLRGLEEGIGVRNCVGFWSNVSRFFFLNNFK